MVVLTPAILGDESLDSFERILWIRGRPGSPRLGLAGVLSLAAAVLIGGVDAGVDVVFVLVVEVVGVAFEMLNAKWLLKDIMARIGN